MGWWQGIENDLIQRLPLPHTHCWENLNRGDENHGLVIAISPHYVAKIFEDSGEGLQRARIQADAHLRLSGRMNVPRLSAYYEIDGRSSIPFPVLIMERIHGLVIADLRPPHEDLDSPEYREYLRVFRLYEGEIRKAMNLGADIPYAKPQNARYLPEKDEVWLVDFSSCYFFTNQTRPRDLSFISKRTALQTV